MPPILVNRPVRMKYLNIVVPIWNVEDAVNVMQESGAIHIVKKGKGIEKYRKLYRKVVETKEMINKILENYAKGRVLDASLTRLELETLNIDDIYNEVIKLYREITLLEDQASKLELISRELKEKISVLSMLEPSITIDKVYYNGRLLSVFTVYGTIDQINSFLKLCTTSRKNIYPLYSSSRENFVIYSFAYTGGLGDIKPLIDSCGLHLLDLSEFTGKATTVGEVLDLIKRRLNEVTSKLSEFRERARRIVEENLDYLAKYLLFTENIYNRLSGLMSSLSSKYLMLLSGWIPADRIGDLESLFREKRIPFYLEARDPVKGVDKPPTLLRNPRVIKWFEPIVKFIGAPNYWEWDPTPVIAYSFAFFYGVMLGDMGYAIAIILSAIYLLDKFVADPTNRDYVFFKKAIISSSIIGFIIGFLSGSFLGDTLQLFGIRYSFTNVFTDPLQFLILAILIGLVHVNLSHALTLVKAWRNRSIGDVLSEIGLFVTEAFGIPYVLYSMLNTPIPGVPSYMYTYFLYGAFAGIAILIAGTVKNMGGLGFLMWLFGITGLLGDVLSYSRLAGVGLATIYLAKSFNAIAIISYHGLSGIAPVIGVVVGGLVALFVAVFGHIVNTALSALGSFIHSLRLCFVEFLSKFYEGTGYMFEPFKIVLKRKIVIE